MSDLPAFVVIGAMKCGTSSLHTYLDAHPQLSMSIVKEPDFFYGHPGGNWSKGLDWYKARFAKNKLLKGEASPNYTKHPMIAGVPSKMHKVLPDAKLIYVLRNPVERIVSHLHHSLLEGRETRTFDEIFAQPESQNTYLYASRYYHQLSQYLPFYDKSKILLVTAEKLKNERAASLRKIFAFLGVDPNFTSAVFGQQQHATAHKKRPNLLVRAVHGNALLDQLRLKAKALLPDGAYKKISAALHINKTVAVTRPGLTPAQRRHLCQLLQDDMRQLKQWSGYSFDEWRP